MALRHPAMLRTLWWISTPLLPLLAVQGKRARRDTTVLPEAEGPTRGRSGETTGDTGTELRLLCVGDSTAAGVGAGSHDAGVAARLAELLADALERPVAWDIRGRAGADVRAMTRDLVPGDGGPWDVTLVLAGVNDTTRLRGETDWTADVRGLAEALRAAGARAIVFAGVPPVGAFPALPHPLRYVLGLRARLLDAALGRTLEDDPHAHHAPFDLPLEGDYVAEDGYHPSAQGYAAWAHALLPHVVRALRSAGTVPSAP